MDSASSSCALSGTPSPECRGSGVCSRCLLRLGLDPSGTADAAEGGHAPRHGHGVMDLPEQFIRQGVLPQFGDYELLAEIARGGMGVVYRARQRGLDRLVAVKLILAGQLATRESVERFRREAQAAAHLHHPGIVPIYEIGEYETQHFFSMELIDGASLAECLAEFALQRESSPSERRQQELCIAETLAQVARALEFAHQHGVLHRDVKPSNILIDQHGRPRLTDFGLAKLTGREGSGLTLSNTLLGSPSYLAPEQAAGKMDEVTIAADVYGLGATLYELLTGRPPFLGSTAVATMWMAINESPAPPRKLNPVVHRDLETIALRCLEKRPEQRYASAACVADELERFMRREPIQARPVNPAEQAWRWCQRNPKLAAMACALLVVILAGSGGALSQWLRAERANQRLTEYNSHLEWESIDTLVNHGQASRALALVAAQLRKDPQDWRAAMFGMSLMNERRFPIPAAPTIRHPGGAELAVARLSPDGSRIVTASSDGTARLWDAVTSEQLGPPLEHKAPVTWAEFRPDGRVLATCSQDKTVRLWDVATGRPICEPQPQDDVVLKVQFSANGWYLLTRTKQTVSILSGSDGRTLVKPLRHDGGVVAARFQESCLSFMTAQDAGDKSQVRVWLLPFGLKVASLLTGPMRDADLNSDFSRVVVAGRDGHGWVADFPSGEHRAEIVSRNGATEHVAFSARGDYIASLGVNNWARVWDSRTALPITGELPHYHALAGLEFLPDGWGLLTWGNDSLAQVWNIPEDKPYCEPLRHADRVSHAEFRKRGRSEFVLTTASLRDAGSSRLHTGAAQMWEVAEAPHQGDVEFGIGFNGIHTSTVSADGRRIAMGQVDGAVSVHDRLTGAVVCGPLQVNGKGGAPKLLFSPDASRMLTTTAQGEVSVWSIPDGRRLGGPVKLSSPLEPAATTADGRYFATVAGDGTVRLWDSTTGQSPREMRHGSGLNAIGFSPDGRVLASAGTDRVVRLWQTATGKLASELKGHQDEVVAVFFSPDGRKLVTASLDFTIRIWNAADGRELAVLAHGGEVLDACFSPDGRFVASASRDRTAMIWNVETGRPHTRPLEHEQSVISVRFSPDSRQLLTMDYRGLRLWDVATGRPLTVRLAEQFQLGTGFQTDNGRPVFTSNGLAVFVAGDSYVSRILHISTPPAGVPAWFAEFLEGVAGQRFESGAELPAVVPEQSFLALRQRVMNSADKDYYTRWVREWLGARNAVRSIP